MVAPEAIIPWHGKVVGLLALALRAHAPAGTAPALLETTLRTLGRVVQV